MGREQRRLVDVPLPRNAERIATGDDRKSSQLDGTVWVQSDWSALRVGSEAASSMEQRSSIDLHLANGFRCRLERENQNNLRWWWRDGWRRHDRKYRWLHSGWVLIYRIHFRHFKAWRQRSESPARTSSRLQPNAVCLQPTPCWRCLNGLNGISWIKSRRRTRVGRRKILSKTASAFPSTCPSIFPRVQSEVPAPARFHRHACLPIKAPMNYNNL